MKNKFVCIHGHFYQPPRENPWTEEVETEESAAPDHDWNQRIFRECYRANLESPVHLPGGLAPKLINNYEHISFNFGPTLLSWMERRHPGAYARLLTSDSTSRAVRGGHGNALAQAFNHAILPLAPRRDKLTQIRWGVADFQARFGRAPEGLWLPETAVDEETLECLIAEGLRFAILAPRQSAQQESLKKRPAVWQSRESSGKSISLFFYDDAVSRGIAFEGLLHDGEAFARRIEDSFAPNDEPEVLVVATDGESYGHHHRFGNMALSFAIDRFLSGRSGIKLVNPGQYLDLFPTRDSAEIRTRTSWSCVHGIGRWKEDCGCNSGAHPDWRQRWRAPLRQALDELASALDGAYEEKARSFFADPWKARDAYVARLLAKDFAPNEFLEKWLRTSIHKLASTDGGRSESEALLWCELQRNRLLMFTSCGWFFDDIGGIEAVQILKYAGRALDLAQRLGVSPKIEADFLKRLERAASNDPKMGDGAKIYRERILPLRVTPRRAVAHFALADHLDGAIAPYPVFETRLGPTWRSALPSSAGQGRLSVRRVHVRDRLTLETFESVAAVWQLGERVECRLRAVDKRPDSALIEQADAAHRADDGESVRRWLDSEFETDVFGLDALFADDHRRALERLGREKATTKTW